MATQRVCRTVTVGLTLTVMMIFLAPVRQATAQVDPALDAQQFVYELNRARWNPTLFAAESGITMPVVPSAPPVAIQQQLTASATFKANEMADNSYFGHQSPVTGMWPNQLVRDTGYPLPSSWPDDQNYLESIHSGSLEPSRVVAAFAVSPSHRVHVFGENGFSTYTEIGVGRSGTASYWTVHLARRDAPLLTVTGVVFADTDLDGRMDLGEGLGGVTVVMGGVSTVTNLGGGYALPLPSSPATITASVDGVAITGAITPLGYSIGVDFVAGDARAIVRAYELCEGLKPTILGTDHDDTIVGTSGDDIIHGLGGDDTIDSGAGNDVVCGGDGADIIDGTPDPARLAGADRYGTAVAVSQHAHPAGASTVYLAIGLNYPDALAAGPAAAREDAPILLVASTTVPTVTRNELIRLDPHTVVILGGTAAIADQTVDMVRQILPHAAVDRRWGATRYETAVAVTQAAFPDPVDTVFITTGSDFPDALIAAPAAINANSPLLLVGSSVPAAVQAELIRLQPNHIIVVGGTSSVSSQVFDELNTYAPTTRVSAPDRYSLAAAVSAATFSSSDTVYIATGANFPDALTAGAATASPSGPILLVTSSTIPTAVHDELIRLGVTNIMVLGGPAAISDSVLIQLAATLNP